MKQAHTQPTITNTGIQPVKGNITHTRENDRIVISYSERSNLKEVRCNKGHLLVKATIGSVVECKCDKCKTIEVYKVAA